MTAETRGLAVVQPQQFAVPQYAAAPAIDWDEVEQLVNTAYLRNTSPEQRYLLMAWCRRFQLDPLAQEVVLIQGRPFVTLAGLIRVADRSQCCDGMTATSELVAEGKFAGKYIATATVWHKGRGHATVMQARQWEHERLPRERKGESPWERSPAVMTEKCALARALRLTFSLVGLTAAEEVGYDEESEETNAGKVIVMQPDQGRSGRAPAQLPAASQAARVAQVGESAAQPAEEGKGAEDFTWTEFWPWARARGLNDRKSLDEALGRSTSAMTPQEMYLALRAKEAAANAATKERRSWTVDDAIAWLQAQERPLDKQEQCCAWIFGQADDEATLAALAERVTPLVHQDARDAAWHDRMLALGLVEDGDPAVEEPPAVMAESAATPAGDDYGDVPF